MPRTKNETVPRQFRLRSDTLAELDLIAGQLSRTTGTNASRADAIRYAARQESSRIRKKLGKSA